MTPLTQLIVGQSYYLDGMRREMWDAPHPVYGAPESIGARYLGCLHGARRWHGFEVWAGGEERGVLFMTDADLEQLRVIAIG